MHPASQIFDFISSHGDFSHRRIEVASAGFGSLRRNMGAIIRHLGQSDDIEAAHIANSMRVLLFKLLTSPVAFDNSILEAVLPFGSPEAFEARWGLRGEFCGAAQSVCEMITEGNPIRAELLALVRKMRSDKQVLKIFCHRTSREQFDSLFVPPEDDRLNESMFFHSPRDYSNCAPFNSLIKVGPLRSQGWGAIPDAVASAPRFETLIQLVWSGCANEVGFGYDPVAPLPSAGGNAGHQSHDTLHNQVSWKQQVTRVGTDPCAGICYPEGDEFAAFSEPNQQGLKRRAILLEILDGDGILYPRKAEVLSFDPMVNSHDAADIRVPGESLDEGMFLVLSQLGEVGFGESANPEGGYNQIWKQRLREELQTSPDNLCRILRYKGLHLQSLRGCVENWAEPPHAVIHAPQKMRHFQILIEALAIDPALTQSTKGNERAWWQRAWDEIRVTRGEAIQTGMQEHAIIEQQALEFLRSILPELRQRVPNGDGFRLQIPPGHDLHGAFIFFKVLRLEEGFLAPETELKVVRDLHTIEQWRVT